MLNALSIRDIVLIEKLDLALENGLTILTGETGAGKSILLDSLGLALGARGDSSLVRSGQAKGSVAASFSLPKDHAALALLSAHDVDTEGEIIIRRIQNADGPSRATNPPRSNESERSSTALTSPNDLVTRSRRTSG